MTATSITRIRPTRAAWNTPPAALRTSTTPRWDGKSPGKSPRAGRMSSTRPTARSAADPEGGGPQRRRPLVGGVAGIGGGGGREAVLLQPGGAYVVGADQGRADAGDQREPRDRDTQPVRAGQEREPDADRHHEHEEPPDRAAAPAGVGELVPHPLPVLGRQPETHGEQQPAA